MFVIFCLRVVDWDFPVMKKAIGEGERLGVVCVACMACTSQTRETYTADAGVSCAYSSIRKKSALNTETTPAVFRVDPSLVYGLCLNVLNPALSPGPALSHMKRKQLRATMEMACSGKASGFGPFEPFNPFEPFRDFLNSATGRGIRRTQQLHRNNQQPRREWKFCKKNIRSPKPKPGACCATFGFLKPSRGVPGVACHCS